MQKNSTRRSTPYRLAESSLSIACKGVPAPVGAGAMTVLCSGQPADDRDDELELVDDDPELDLLEDLGGGQED